MIDRLAALGLSPEAAVNFQRRTFSQPVHSKSVRFMAHLLLRLRPGPIR